MTDPRCVVVSYRAGEKAAAQEIEIPLGVTSWVRQVIRGGGLVI
jgi:hypothetical protein